MKLRYHGPFDEVDVAGQTVKHNHQFDVADDVAGKAPDPRLAEAMAELFEAVNGHPDHEAAARLRDEITRLDHGEGLLAQPDNYTAVPAKSAKDGEK